MKETNPIKIGYLCSYTPLEIIYASGCIPIRISGHCNPIKEADSHLHPNLCQYIRSCMDCALSGEYDDIDGLIFITSCDAMRRLYDVWKYQFPNKFYHIMDLPTGNQDTAIDYLSNEFDRLKISLENITNNKISDEKLIDSIEIYNESREIFKKLNNLRNYTLPKLWGMEVVTKIHEFFEIDPKNWNVSAQNLYDNKRSDENAEIPKYPRVLIAGSPIHATQFISFIEECGLNVVYEDTCTGSKFFDIIVTKEKDIMHSLASAYLKKTPCARMMLFNERAKNIIKIAEEFKVDGIIHYSLKFCDTNLYDVPKLKEELKKSGFTTLFLEGDGTLGSFGQLKTRIETFIEILNGK